MMSQAKKNNAILGGIWMSLGLLIILYGISLTFTSTSAPTQISEMTTLPTPTGYTESVSSVLMSRESSPRVILEPQLIIEPSNMSFRLDNSYMVAYEMFKSKTIVTDNMMNTKQQFEDFLQLYGIKLDAGGMLVDVRGSIVPSRLIECHVMGYFPDRPYIKSNCI